MYRSGHNGPDSKSGSPHGLVGSNPTASAIDKKVPIRVPFIIYTEQRTAVGFEGDYIFVVDRRNREAAGIPICSLYVANNRFFLLHMSCIDIIVPV